MILVYDILTWVFSRLIEVFFREVKVRGSHKIPLNGPVIFIAAPHANQFLDPLILIKNVPRRISFLAAQVSWDRMFVGRLIKAMRASNVLIKWLTVVPVARPQDSAYKGQGTVTMGIKENDSYVLLGFNSNLISFKLMKAKFTEQVKEKDTITFGNPRISGQVLSVHSDSKLELKYSSSVTVAAANFSFPSDSSKNYEKVDYKVTPHIDQSQMFSTVVEHLASGECVGLFPEGGSHDRSELMPLKAGFAVMALSAMSVHEGLNVQIVPTGLHYFHPDRFRSRAVVEFGDPIEIKAEWLKQFKQGGEPKRQAIQAVVQLGLESLKAITVTAPDYDTLMVIQASRRLYRPDNIKLNLDQIAALTRNFAIGYEQFGNEARVQELTKRVKEYNSLLQIYGIKDHQVKNVSFGALHAIRLLIYRILILTVLCILAIPGLLLNSPIASIASKIAVQKAKEAKAASSVKLKGTDVISTWKIIIASILVPSFYAFYTAIFALILLYIKRINDPYVLAQYSLVFGFLILPIISFLTMKLSELGMDILKSLRPLFLCIFPFNGHSPQKLIQVRNELQKFLNSVIEEYGPQAFSNFENKKIISDALKRDQVAALAEYDFDDEFKWSEIEGDDVDDVFIRRLNKNPQPTLRQRRV